MRNWWSRIRIKLFHELAKNIYPDDQDRACAFAGEAAQLYGIIQFREGEPMEQLVITCHPEGGYIVSPRSKEEAIS